MDRLDGNGNTNLILTQLTYDAGGRKTAMDDADMGSWSYTTYDAQGNLMTQTDARNCTTTLSYDLNNRLTGKVYSGACSSTASVTYAYDAGNNGKGHRTSMTDGSGSTTWTYDNRGRMTAESKTIGSGNFLTQWSYNSADQITSLIYPGDNAGNAGEQVNYSYLPQMALNSVNGTNVYVSSTTYAAAGRMLTRQLNNGAFHVTDAYYAWNTQGGRLNTIQSGTNSLPTSLQYLEYAYDPVGNITTITDHLNGPQTQTFGYNDGLNRLTSAGASGGSSGNGNYGPESYSYDAATGNLISKGGVTLAYGAQSASCPDGALTKAHAAIGAGTNTYCYDPNGNMVKRNLGGTVYTLIYDAENRLVGVSGGGTTASFAYDGDGNRVSGTINGVITSYISNYFEWTGSTTSMVKYYYAGSVRVAQRQGAADL